MRCAKYVFLVLAFLDLSCQEPTRPKDGSISGVVAFQNGALADSAMVSLNLKTGSGWTHSETSCDSLGRYEFAVNAMGDSVSLWARGALPRSGVYAGVSYGSVIFVAKQPIVKQDIALTHFMPI